MGRHSNVICYRKDCFQNVCGVSCQLLTGQITGHPCPFYKTDQQVLEERRKALERLEEKDMHGLIESYIFNPERNW